MVAVGFQPFTVSALGESTPRTIDRVAAARYEGIELGPTTDDATLDALAEHDLAVTSSTVSRDALEAGEVDHGAYATLGVEDVVLMWLDEERFGSREAVESTAADLDAWADSLAEHGLTLHYHNHAHEFVDLGDEFAYEALVDATDAVRFELDLGWAGTGGADPVTLLDRIGDRVTHAHLKDMDFDSGAFVTFGEGDLDVAAAVGAARDNDLEWLIVENDDPVDPVAEPAHASLLLDRHTGHVCR